jgi:hypothetical protein
MPKQKLSIQQSDKKYGGYYRLVTPPQTFFEQLQQFTWRAIRFPYSVYQTVVGRLLSYFVINPLFRKEEKDHSLILQHPKHPDPLFSQLDEMSVINVFPKKNILIRAVLNWHNFFINHMTTAKIANSLLSRIARLLPSGKDYVYQYLDKLVDKVEAKIQGKKGTPFQPSQIHFRGIEHLSAEQQEALYQKLAARLNYDFSDNRKHIYFYTLQTTDNAILDSVEVRNPNEAFQDITNRRFIVASMPRSNNFIDWLKHYQVYAQKLDATIIAFNYRGVGLSRGVVTNEKDLYADAYEQVQRLLQLGAKPENIAMMGECLGGNVATHTAGTLQAENLPVKLFSARSFRSLTSIIEGRNMPHKDASLWHPRTWLGWLKYGLVTLIFNPIIRSAGWSLNVDDKFLVVPPHDRDFIVVRSKKDEQAQRFADDKMVPHKKSSTYSLVKEQFKEIKAKKEKGGTLSTVEQEWLSDTPKQHKFHVSEQLHATARTANGHTVHPRLLVSTNPQANNAVVDGREYTLNFFRRMWPKKKEEVELQLDTSSTAPEMNCSL